MAAQAFSLLATFSIWQASEYTLYRNEFGPVLLIGMTGTILVAGINMRRTWPALRLMLRSSHNSRNQIFIAIFAAALAILITLPACEGLILSATRSALDAESSRRLPSMTDVALAAPLPVRYDGIVADLRFEQLNTASQELELNIRLTMPAATLQQLFPPGAVTPNGSSDLLLRISDCTQAPCTANGEIPVSTTQRMSDTQDFGFETTARVGGLGDVSQFPADTYRFFFTIGLVKTGAAGSTVLEPVETAIRIDRSRSPELRQFDLVGQYSPIKRPGVPDRFGAFRHDLTIHASRPLFPRIYAYLIALVPTVFVTILTQLLFRGPTIGRPTLATIYVGLAAALLTILPLRAVLVPAPAQSSITQVDLILAIQIGLTAAAAAAYNLRYTWRSGLREGSPAANPPDSETQS